jgi:hypothetical protein
MTPLRDIELSSESALYELECCFWITPRKRDGFDLDVVTHFNQPEYSVLLCSIG